MALTRQFRNGNSQSVRIPADLAYGRSDLDAADRAGGG
jgi:virulence-associated protein VagC